MNSYITFILFFLPITSSLICWRGQSLPNQELNCDDISDYCLRIICPTQFNGCSTLVGDGNITMKGCTPHNQSEGLRFGFSQFKVCYTDGCNSVVQNPPSSIICWLGQGFPFQPLNCNPTSENCIRIICPARYDGCSTHLKNGILIAKGCTPHTQKECDQSGLFPRCRICNTDGCNSGAKSPPSLILLSILITSATFLTTRLTSSHL